jgi:hypothetical protein
MNGHEALQRMRRDKRAPRCVWITDGDDVRARDWQNEPNCFDLQKHAVISIAADDIPEALDFRCCIGLEVHVAGDRGAARARRLHAALIDAGARRVITSIYEPAETLVHIEEKALG